jgi:hypothetical protein
MSTSRNPNELVDRYLQAVRFWTSKPQEDLIAELGEDLRSQIEAKEHELGRALDQAEVSAILKTCGAPMIVGSRLGPKRQLIGPALFPTYIFVMKMVLLWILVPVFLFIVGPTNLASSNGNWGMAVLNTFGDLWSGLFIAAGIITLVFAIVERSPAHAAMESRWDPLKLPAVRKQERKTSFAQTICELAFGVFGVMWLLLLPHYPVLILGPGAVFLRPAPVWHAFYLPILLLGVVAVIKSGITLAKPQWGWFPDVGELVQAVLSLLLLNFILNAAGHAPAGSWQPFVVLREAAKDSGQYIRVAAIVNVSILVSLAASWLGLCIALVIHLWRFLRYVSKRASGTQQPASLQAR